MHGRQFLKHFGSLGKIIVCSVAIFDGLVTLLFPSSFGEGFLRLFWILMKNTSLAPLLLIVCYGALIKPAQQIYICEETSIFVLRFAPIAAMLRQTHVVASAPPL